MTSATPSDDDSARRLAPTVFARLAEVSQVLLPGIYAWAVTVVPTTKTTPLIAFPSIAAFLALACLVSGALIARTRPNAGFALGIWGFLIGCLATWLLGASALQMERLDPWRAGAGSIGWGLFALGWGTPWRVGHHPEDDPRALLHPKLEPRSPPRLQMALSVAVGTIGAITCMLLAWRAGDQNRALLCHGAALACSVAVVNASAKVGLAQRSKRVFLLPRARVTHVFPWILAASALVVVAVAWALSR